MFELSYDASTAEVYLINKSNDEKVLIGDMASAPVFNTSGVKAVFISPLEWECIGDTYVVDLQDGKVSKLPFEQSEDLTPKFAQWLNEKDFLLIIGYAFGTVSIGGNIYLVDSNNFQLKLVDQFPEEVQVTSIDILKNNDVLYTGIQYIDDIFNTSMPYRSIKAIQSILG